MATGEGEDNLSRTAPPRVLSVGYSQLTLEAFVERIAGAKVTAIADVRSAPYSRRQPHFDREALRAALKARDIAYVFLGKELGGRPSSPELFDAGVADYDQIARTPLFEAGLKRVLDGARRYRVCLMCSEAAPLDCHRCLLVGRALHERSVEVIHLLADGSECDQAAVEQQLIEMAGGDRDFFQNPAERLAAAYRKRAKKVAYSTIPPSQNQATRAQQTK